ncbi:hypothetical protein GCM10010387_57770 [Streptomyces inusitatus]|uniref:DUF1877 family protein n=1 Tax=Streptomyces inusitatus TaxID=68221 RepID=A0A918QKX4_9ACTN|nr:DUF1877 family protein [Streptomyces inusitatus]GGZ56202.1 hypothetical protein GCM10010387_57770 [Streptomyces inusitatus]
MSTELLIRELCRAVLDGVASGGRARPRLRVTGLGRHFAVEPADAVWLADAGAAALAAYAERAEESWEDRWSVDTDTAWKPLHRALSGGPAPLARAILGGRPLTAAPGCLLRLLPPDRVPATAEALTGLTRPWLRARLAALGHPPGLSCESCAWEHLHALRAFHTRAADAGRGVLFTVSD